MTFFRIKIFVHQTIKAHDNLCFPLRRAYLLLLSPTLHKSHGDFHPSFLHFILWQALCVGKDPDIYTQLDVGFHKALLLTLPLR